jgi:hypothetical protein
MDMDIECVIDEELSPELEISREVFGESILEIIDGRRRVDDRVVQKQMWMKATVCLLLCEFGKQSKTKISVVFL